MVIKIGKKDMLLQIFDLSKKIDMLDVTSTQFGDKMRLESVNMYLFTVGLPT